ncbi:MAG: hypothetical protein AAF432_15590, partial [Planctomycetota bacterium]
MTATTALIRKAKRRIRLNRMVRWGARGLIVGIVLGVIAVLVERIVGLQWPILTAPATACAGLAIGLFVAIVRPTPTLDAAVRIDRALHLGDQIGSAVALNDADAAQWQDEAGSALVRKQADHIASRLDLRSALPVELTGDWGLALVLAIMLGGIVMWMPRRGGDEIALTPAEQAAQQVEINEEREALAATIDDALDPLEDLLDEETSPEVRDQLETLDRLAEQLNQPVEAMDADLDRVREDVATRLDEVAEDLRDDADRELAAVDDVTRQFAGMPERDVPMSAEDFEDALRRGEFGRAAEAFDALRQQQDELTDEEREQLADHLRDRADDVESQQDFAELEQRERRRALEQTLRDEGIDDELARSLIDDTTMTDDDVRQRLRESGLDDRTVDDLARDIDESRRQDDADARSQERLDDLRDALDDAADTFDEPSSTDPNAQGEQQQQPSNDPNAQDEQQQQPSTDPNAQGEQQQQPSNDPNAQGEQQQRPSTDPDAQGEQQQPSTDPNAQGEQQQQPSTDPDAQGEQQQQPSNDPNAQGEQQQQPSNDPDAQGEQQQQPSTDPNAQGEQQ